MGDAEIGLLADTLSQMLDEWRNRLEQSKPSFPLGPARWGVLQMCMYDMWCTIEESRIWDVGLAETERFAHFFSPQLAAMLGRIRTRQSQAFDTTLSMSQRLQYELQRWNAQWNETAESFRREESTRQALQHHCHQLEAHVAQLEAENEIASALAASAASAAANGDDADPNAKRLETTLRRLQQQVVRLSQQLRQAHASNTSLRGICPSKYTKREQPAFCMHATMIRGGRGAAPRRSAEAPRAVMKPAGRCGTRPLARTGRSRASAPTPQPPDLFTVGVLHGGGARIRSRSSTSSA